MTDDQILTDLRNTFGKEFTAADVRGYCASKNISYQTITKRLENFKVGRGKWNLTVEQAKQQLESIVDNSVLLGKTAKVAQNLIPSKDDTFVQFGNFSSLKKVIASRIFYPVFITGLSGNGKTFGVEQACAQLGRELIRVNITVETDEDDLIGGFRLVNGETVWHNGPVIEALERGAVLLLDEIDLASNNILCLQSILERFPITFEQEYPTPAVENKILRALCEQLNVPLIGEHEKYISHLCTWADIVRKTFAEGGIDEIISTRRLTHIIRAYSIFGDKMKAIELCLNRFDEETKQSFVQLYTKLDDTVVVSEQSED